MYILASFVEDKVSIGAWIYLWAFYFVPLIYISVFVPYCLCTILSFKKNFFFKYKFIYFDAKSLQSCLTLCNPIDGSPPGSPISGILQARTLEWVAISFSNA